MQQSTHPAIHAAITVARSLNETRFQQLLTMLDGGNLSLTAGVLHLQRVLHFPAAESRTVISLFRRWQEWGKDIQTLITTLQAIRATCTAMQDEVPSVCLVWTGPVSLPGATRTTGSVLIELIDHAQQEIVIVGYALAETARDIFKHLADAQQRGVQIVMIIDRMEEEKPLRVLRTCWPRNQDWPILYTRQASISDSKSALHAKAVIVDGHSLLATSANLSYHGLAGNIELGVLVEGRIAQEAVTLLKLLITEEICIQVNPEIT